MVCFKTSFSLTKFQFGFGRDHSTNAVLALDNFSKKMNKRFCQNSLINN